MKKEKIRILYVHGFNGHADGGSAQLLREAFKDRKLYYDACAEIDAPAIPFMNPKEAVEFIETKSKDYDFVVASSLGAFFTMQTGSTPKILVNPAIPSDLLKLEGVSLEQSYLDELESQKEAAINIGTDYGRRDITHFIFGTKDEIAQNSELIIKGYKIAEKFPRYTWVEMGHHLDERGCIAVRDAVEDYIRKHYIVYDAWTFEEMEWIEEYEKEHGVKYKF